MIRFDLAMVFGSDVFRKLTQHRASKKWSDHRQAWHCSAAQNHRTNAAVMPHEVHQKSNKRIISPTPASLPMYNACRSTGLSATISRHVKTDKLVHDGRDSGSITLYGCSLGCQIQKKHQANRRWEIVAGSEPLMFLTAGQTITGKVYVHTIHRILDWRFWQHTHACTHARTYTHRFSSYC